MDNLIHLFEQYPQLAILISIGISILVAIAGVLPSVFITAANILFFGLWEGILLSFVGEAAGALVAFVLYRKGFKKKLQQGTNRFLKVKKLLNAQGMEAFWLIVSLRLIPFVPSGLITFAAAIGKVNIGTFFVASSLGKIPALLIEAYSVYQVTAFGWQGKLILAMVAIGILVYIIRARR